MAVPVLVAAVVLEGTTGLVEKVLVQAIVSAQVLCTTSASVALDVNTVCRSVWSDKVPVMFHHSADVCVFDITQFAILIQVPAVYFVSVAEIVFQFIWIFAQAVSVFCFQLRAFVITLFSTGFVLVVERLPSTAIPPAQEFFICLR